MALHELRPELRKRRCLRCLLAAQPAVDRREIEVAALVRDLFLMTRADKHVPDRVAALLMARWAVDMKTRLTVQWTNLDTMSR